MRCIIAGFQHFLAVPRRRGSILPVRSAGFVNSGVIRGVMRGLTRTVAFIILFSLVLAAAESVHSLYNKGVKAEAREDYEAAYQYYKAAYDKHPEDLKYRVPFQRTKFLAAASMIKRAQKLRDDGKLQEALDVFLKAAAIDPSNDLAIQEVRRTQAMIKGQTSPETAPAPHAQAL